MVKIRVLRRDKFHKETVKLFKDGAIEFFHYTNMDSKGWKLNDSFWLREDEVEKLKKILKRN